MKCVISFLSWIFDFIIVLSLNFNLINKVDDWVANENFEHFYVFKKDNELKKNCILQDCFFGC